MLELQILLWCGAFAALLAAGGALNYAAARRVRANSAPPKHVWHEGRRLSFYPALAADRASPLVVLWASLGRAASDFNELVAVLQMHGYGTLALEARGLLDKTGLKDETVSLFDLAADAHAVLRSEGLESRKLFLVGHGFGNRVARAYATQYPAQVRAIVLLGAGGPVPLARKAQKALRRSFWIVLPDWWRLRHVRRAFFAGKNPIPDFWRSGWNGRAAALQARASRALKANAWQAGGGAPMLVVQGMQDVIAPPLHASMLLRNLFPKQIQVAELEAAGHALLPEQPRAIEEAVLPFFRAQMEAAKTGS